MKRGVKMISASTNSPANCAEQRPPAAQLPEEITVPAPPEKTGTVNASTPLGKLIAALGLKQSVVIPFTLKSQRFACVPGSVKGIVALGLPRGLRGSTFGLMLAIPAQVAKLSLTTLCTAEKHYWPTASER